MPGLSAQRQFVHGARMGAMLALKADEPTREVVRDLKDMETARQAPIRDRTAAKARLSVATLLLLRKQASLRLRQTERDISNVDAAIESAIRTDRTLSPKADILTSIPGVQMPRARMVFEDQVQIKAACS